MKLLICTQVVDINHPILGFFHRWIEEFSKYCEEIHIVCLEEGEHHLPDNVKVYSLGKEAGKGRSTYIFRFYKYIWTLRNQYDNVFVHMNEEYAIMGPPVWRILGKKIGHWRMHGKVDLRLRVSEKFVHEIFTGSKESYRLKSKKLHVLGHGIDTEKFAPKSVSKEYDLVTVGRITKSKNLEALVDVLALVREKKDVSLTIIGKPISQAEEEYLTKLKEYIADRKLIEQVHFIGSVPNKELPQHIGKAKVFVHTATNGSLDKALLESLAVGIPVISSGEGAASLPLEDWIVDSNETLANMAIEVLQSDTSKRSEQLREYVKHEHSLSALIPKILDKY